MHGGVLSASIVRGQCRAPAPSKQHLSVGGAKIQIEILVSRKQPTSFSSIVERVGQEQRSSVINKLGTELIEGGALYIINADLPVFKLLAIVVMRICDE